MTMDPNDPDRPLGTDPYYNNPARMRDDDGVGWGLRPPSLPWC